MKVKKVQMIVTALLFLLSCAFLSYSRKVNVYADEYVGFNKTPTEFDDNTEFKDEYDTFLEAYYTNLTDNIGYNLKGSCGYVALGMLLSYYDTYQSDNIIPEKYDCPSADNNIYTMLEPNMNKRHKSPGIYSDEIVKADFEPYNVEKADALSAEQYYEIIKKKADINSDEPSLHAKLLTIGHDLGYYGKLSPEQPGGTTPKMVTEVLKAYLKEIGFAENTDYTLSTGTVSVISGFSKMREFTIENIQKGKPVLIGITNGVFELGRAHYCIAYDYDEKEDEIYANFGWGKKVGHQHTKVSNAYDDYFFALTIDFKMPHSHTNNYGMWELSDEGFVTKYYCWDNCKIITYKQREHEYTDHYEKADSDTYHYAYCVCGDKITENHIWKPYSKPTLTGEYLQCRRCLFIKKLGAGEHIPIPFTKREEEYEES